MSAFPFDKPLGEALRVKKIGEDRYEGIYTLARPTPEARGVYGGHICVQAMNAAQQTLASTFTPHSLHSYFVKAGYDTSVFQYQIERVSDTKNFANRLVKAIQDGVVKYIIQISFTKRNTASELEKGYDPSNPKMGPPISYSKRPPATLDTPDEQLQFVPHSEIGIKHSIPLKFFADGLNDVPAGEKELSSFMKVSHPYVEPELRFLAIGVLADALYLRAIDAMIGVPLWSGSKFSVSLDQSLYIHDSEFDGNDRFLMAYKSPRLINNRALFVGHFYDSKGKLIATFVQEALVHFHKGIETEAKL